MMDVDDGGGQVEDSPRLTWTELRRIIRTARKSLTSAVSQVPHSFCFRSLSSPAQEARLLRLYCLTALDGTRENTICYFDVVRTGVVSGWSKLVGVGLPTKAALSREEQLLRERKRTSHSGITSYDVDTSSGRFLFPAAGSLYTFLDTAEGVVVPDEILTTTRGPRMDPKLCPQRPDLVAFVNQNDLWVTCRDGSERRLTHAHTGSARLEDDPHSAGVPSFIVQEEFDRYTGYWWRPHANSDAAAPYCILYEEVDESRVDIVSIISNTDQHDDYRYPKAGTTNSTSQLKVVEFGVDGSQIVGVRVRELSQNLEHFLTGAEYLVRAGWTPDGHYVWLQVLDRAQTHLRLVLIPLSAFASSDSATPPPSSTPLPSTSPPPSASVCDGAGRADGDSAPPRPVHYATVYDEKSDIWINVTDILHFLPSSADDQVRFIWASEQSGFLHLYLVTSRLAFSSDVAEVREQVALTQGDWEVNNKQVWVDEQRGLVYFVANKDSALETHLYCTSYVTPGEPCRLTEQGFSHAVHVDVANHMFVSVESNVGATPGCHVYHILLSDNNLPVVRRRHTLLKSAVPGAGYIVPSLFSFTTTDGARLHGMVFRPKRLEAGRRYPTVLFVYGGPQVQLVTNAYKGSKFQRLHTLAGLDYAVVVVDGRGSYHRGLRFEGHIKNRMGAVEIEDQVSGLFHIASTTDFIDLSRVAIHGWSYGGYMSLLGLVQRPDVFKMAIAGAPVTSWNLYDTGYSERYMSTPQANPDGYRNGSILLQADKFPNEEHRLLLVHGLIDENVHFTHTKMLCNALIKACKPFDIKVYPAERHGIRSQDANEHYDTSVTSYLQEHL